MEQCQGWVGYLRILNGLPKPFNFSSTHCTSTSLESNICRNFTKREELEANLNHTNLA